MILKYKYREGFGNKQILTETARRAVVRKADRIELVRNDDVWKLTIEGNFTDEQVEGINRYGNYIKA